MTGSLGKRYARALLELARADGSLEATAEELARAVATFEEPRLRLLLMSPAIDAGARRQTARAVVEALGLSPTMSNAVLLLADRDRLGILPDVGRWYGELLDQELGRARATIRTATALGSTQKTEIVELARRLTGCGEVIASTEVDPDLLGGVVLDVAGKTYDGSLRAQLERLSKEMAEGSA